jgi:hypothetical protein
MWRRSHIGPQIQSITSSSSWPTLLKEDKQYMIGNLMLIQAQHEEFRLTELEKLYPCPKVGAEK